MRSSYFEYQKQYAQNSLRGFDIGPRPELAMNMALKYSGSTKSLLDIGCGTAEKMIPLAESFNVILGLEPSFPLVKIAKQYIQKNSLRNAFLIRGISEELPFQSNTFDVITAILTWENPTEIHRVLKQDGVVVIESLGPNDKTAFTRFFGKDANGHRGAHLDVDFDFLKKRIYDKWAQYFSSIEIFNQQWQTSYTKEGLWNLLNNTYTTVRNFDPKKDKPLFDEAVETLEKNGQIILTQNRLVTVAKTQQL